MVANLRLPAVMAVFALACRAPASDKLALQATDAPNDRDGDGIVDADDCAPDDPAVSPRATEVCNGIDDDCDGEVDEDTYTIWYVDQDSDGHGNPFQSVATCEAPDGYVAQGDDCLDSLANTYPGAPELCDGIDNNCDDVVDEGLEVDWFVDADGDGYGDPATAMQACEAPPNTANQAGDCNDDNDAQNPDQVEVCDDIDNNCDSQIDEGLLVTYYLDEDGDGWGNNGIVVEACSRPTGYAEAPGDCDDNDNSVHPEAPELDCTDPIDRNCDGVVVYVDADSDGSAACVDCDDTRADVFPGAVEVCGGGDENCNGLTDDADPGLDPTSASLAYTDADRDGYGDPTTAILACTPPSGTVATAGDCNDAASAVHPGASETCNGIDDDCNLLVDDNAIDGTEMWPDSDCDGYGDPSSTSVRTCTPISGYVADNTDCDDFDPRAAPGNDERCDGADDDCNGVVDDSCESPFEIPAASADALATATTGGACARFGELSSAPDTHSASNLPTAMAALDGASVLYPLGGATELAATELDWSTRYGPDTLASPGFFGTTHAWPSAITGTGISGVARFRGYIAIGCGDPLNYTLGVIGNDSVSFDIEGVNLFDFDWTTGDWVQFEYISFPGPGLYAFEARWATNLCCEIDPLEIIWTPGFVPGYGGYHSFCVYDACGPASTLTSQFDVLDDSVLTPTTTGTAVSCLQCETSADCDAGQDCNTAGICE